MREKEGNLAERGFTRVPNGTRLRAEAQFPGIKKNKKKKITNFLKKRINK